MDEDVIVTIIFGVLGMILVVSSMGFLAPSASPTTFAIAGLPSELNILGIITTAILLAGLIFLATVLNKNRKTRLTTQLPLDPIADYIKRARKNHTDDRIRRDLVQAGWSQDRVDSALR
tara:strand:- start:3053 stop:3409 length:357 start_codon:yes stop_codon:yes gene_type:complete